VIFDFVEDDPNFSNKLRETLEFQGDEIRMFPSAESYLLANNIGQSAILFVDIALPGMNGIQLIQIVKEKYPDLKIVVLSALDSDNILFQALKSGAIGYILKSDLDKLPNLTMDILAGGAVITPTLALRVFKSFQVPSEKLDEGFESLTSREKEILTELISGQSMREVAEELDISLHTAQTHTKNIYKKLQVNNRIQLIRRATDLGLE
jgi:DNA-binding NarL/FixJ family response regulator